ECRVLLVDDEKDYLEVLIRRLSKREVNVAGVSSGEEALQYVQGRPIDVAVLDVKMPGMDGIEVLREIKKLNPLIEVIMLTGHASLEVALEGMRSGAFDYLMKPAEIDELLYKIQDAYRAKTIQEEKIARLEEQKDRQGGEEMS
ncbi:MAG: response regulator, partial [Deltaproteobacteria bacterium]|nr:response regulator [Deltaproteobacteria bacterium]